MTEHQLLVKDMAMAIEELLRVAHERELQLCVFREFVRRIRSAGDDQQNLGRMQRIVSEACEWSLGKC